MEFPFRCTSCGHENMIDTQDLETRPISKLITAEEYICEACGLRKPCFFTTLPLREAMRKLDLMNPNHSSFRYHLAKTMKRAEEIQRRGEKEYGESRRKDLAEPR